MKEVIAVLRGEFEAGRAPQEQLPEVWGLFSSFRWLVSTADEDLASRMVRAANAKSAAAKAKAKTKGKAAPKAPKPKPKESDDSVVRAAGMFA